MLRRGLRKRRGNESDRSRGNTGKFRGTDSLGYPLFRSDGKNEKLLDILKMKKNDLDFVMAVCRIKSFVRISLMAVGFCSCLHSDEILWPALCLHSDDDNSLVANIEKERAEGISMDRKSKSDDVPGDAHSI
jgi:hypothetical protein